MTTKTKTPAKISRATAMAARDAGIAAPVGRSWGACRCYVTFADRLSAADKKVLSGIFVLTPRPGYSRGSSHIYVGYDNFTGRGPTQAAAIAKVLNDAGLSCYADADGD